MPEKEINQSADAVFTAATAAILVSQGRPEGAIAVLEAYEGPLEQLVLPLVLLAGRGARGRGLAQVVGLLHREAKRLQSRARNLS